MSHPQHGLSLPVHFHRCRDGDTVEVRLSLSERVWAIRLIDCWCPELNKPGGLEAKAFAQGVLGAAGELTLFIPMPHYVDNLLKNLTFDRIPGHLFVGDDNLASLLIAAGHATEAKPEAS